MKKVLKNILVTAAVSVFCSGLAINSYAVSSKPSSDNKLSSKSIAHAASLKYGVVDYMAVFQMVPQGKDKLLAMKNSLQPKIDALKKQQSDLQAQMQKLQKDAPTLTNSQKQEKQQDLLKKQADFQMKVKSIQDDETAKEQAAAVEFQNAVKQAIDAVGKRDGYDLVFNSQAVPYSTMGSDLSHEVIAEMKKEANK